jgi:hypothetical protein
MNPLSQRFARLGSSALLGLTCLVGMGTAPSFASAASHASQATGETLHVRPQFRTVTGGRTTSCSSRMLSHYIRASGCQKVIVTTVPGSKILMTLRYSTNKQYIMHKTGYADARGVYQWVFAVKYSPSTRALRGSVGIVEVSAVLGHSVKVGYTVFRVL